MDKDAQSLRVGIVGVGNIGNVHAASIFQGAVRGMTLTALCDVCPKKRDRLAKDYPGIPVFASHEEMLASGLTDTVIVATPHRLHPIIAADAFKAGQNVLTEKPVGVDCKSVRDLYSVAKHSGKAFGIMFNQRTDPLFIKARELVKSGRLGMPKRLVWIITNWYRTQSYYDSGSWRATWDGEGGGVLLNQAPHNIDLWQWIFGMPSRVRAFCYNGKYHNIPVEDDATVYAEYENGAGAVFITTTGEYPGTNRLEISGDRGKIVIEHGILSFYELSYPERDYCFYSSEHSAPEVTVQKFENKKPVLGHKQILTNFASHILHGEKLIAPGYEGIFELMISNAAYLSTWTDDWVELPFDEDLFASMLDRAAENTVSKVVKGETTSPQGYRDRWQVQW